MITGGFGSTLDLKTGVCRRWYIHSDGIKRWADTDKPVDAVTTSALPASTPAGSNTAAALPGCDAP